MRGNQREFAIAVFGGALTSLLWFATQLSQEWQPAFYWVPAAVLSVLLALAFRRRRFSAVLGYLLGLSPMAVLPALVLATFVGLDAFQAVNGTVERLQRRPFDAAEWRADSEGGARAHMVDDLVANRRLEGRTRQQVEELLGPPSGNHGSPADELAYWISTDRGWLCVALKDGRAQSVSFAPYDD
jgi:hypothetical protein